MEQMGIKNIRENTEGFPFASLHLGKLIALLPEKHWKKLLEQSGIDLRKIIDDSYH